VGQAEPGRVRLDVELYVVDTEINDWLSSVMTQIFVDWHQGASLLL
jgi:hypothetical protein